MCVCFSDGVLCHTSPGSGWELTQIKACFHILAPAQRRTLPSCAWSLTLFLPAHPLLTPCLRRYMLIFSQKCKCTNVPMWQWLWVWRALISGAPVPHRDLWVPALTLIPLTAGFLPACEAHARSNCSNIQLLYTESFLEEIKIQISWRQVNLRQLPVICCEVSKLAAGSLSLLYWVRADRQNVWRKQVLLNSLWCHKHSAHMFPGFLRPHSLENIKVLHSSAVFAYVWQHQHRVVALTWLCFYVTLLIPI